MGPEASGTWVVEGAVLRFLPDLAGLCDGSDGGLLPNRSYSATLAGRPEEGGLRSLAGARLPETRTLGFRTGGGVDPALFHLDPDLPFEVSASLPAEGAQAVAVEDGNHILLTLSKPVQPCSLSAATARLSIYQRGALSTFQAAEAGAGRPSGFATAGGDTSDQAPGDPYSWGPSSALPDVTTLPTAQTLPVRLLLDQRAGESVLRITPDVEGALLSNSGRARFPENALLVVEVTSGLRSADDQPLDPFVLSFTTENLPPQESAYTVDASGETTFADTETTADVNTLRAPGLIQGFLLFAGDGDNGGNQLLPTLPEGGSDCAAPRQMNDGVADDFDPGADVLLDTGDSLNGCPNGVDGSQAVVWEFRSLRIRSGVTVRIVGRNPAILLVQGDARIDAGGRLLARGDGEGGAPRGAGEGDQPSSTRAGTAGGVGVAGGGNGGSSPIGISSYDPPRLGGHGVQGYYHDPSDGTLATDVGVAGGTGGGHGNISARWNEQVNPNNRNTPSGGGGGHALPGAAGVALGSGDSPTSLDGPEDGAAGSTYGSPTGTMRLPEAGSGGGAGGEIRAFSTSIGRGPGGAGGAGGGFLDLSAGGSISILGTIDAAGSDGGSNAAGPLNPVYAWNPGTGGGGGGSGGGVRLLTPREITLGTSTVITVAGGRGGLGRASNGTSPPVNDGGDGGHGRIVLEDVNSVIAGLSAASLTPSEGTMGFYRGTFDGSRFQDGGRVVSARTTSFTVGAFDPDFLEPRQDYGAVTDFVAEIPTAASRGLGVVSILIEARGLQMQPDGTPDETTTSDWRFVGSFADSGTEALPTWTPGAPPLAEIGGALPAGNLGGAGLAALDTCEYLQVRITFFLPATLRAQDPGPALQSWTLRATSDH